MTFSTRLRDVYSDSDDRDDRSDESDISDDDLMPIERVPRRSRTLRPFTFLYVRFGAINPL